MLVGALVVTFAGLLTGSSSWPIKLMKSYHYEHFAFVSMLVGLFLGPWLVIAPLTPFRKLTQLATEAIRQATLPISWKVTALFDSYYLCPAMVEACQQRNWLILR